MFTVTVATAAQQIEKLTMQSEIFFRNKPFFFLCQAKRRSSRAIHENLGTLHYKYGLRLTKQKQRNGVGILPSKVHALLFNPPITSRLVHQVHLQVGLSPWLLP